MKIRYATSHGRLEFEFDASTTKEAFEWLATIQELFEEGTCGLCSGSNLRYDVREFDGNNYYKLACRDCGATLDFGQRRDGSNLFIKRKDADGNALPSRGWYHYNPGDSPRAIQPAARKPVPAQRTHRGERRGVPGGERVNSAAGAAVPF